jgi:hypothetical protein
VGHADARLRDPLGERGGAMVDATDLVVHPEHLPTSPQLPPDRAEGHLFFPRPDVREDGLPVLRRRVDHRQVPDAGQRHLQRPGDRRGRHGQDIHVYPKALDLLLVSHAEPLLLVDDQQPQFLEPHVR